MHAEFWPEYLEGSDHMKDTAVGGRIILKWILQEKGGRMWTGLIWLRVETSVGHL
jgi:hypothetical protein